jgi:predicted AlkP superfamily pyrophosphatase or phosphodiesterase
MPPRFPACASFVLISVAAATSHAQTTAAASTSTARPRLVVFVSVDQMRADYLERFRPLYRAGLKRLIEQGAVFTRAMYRHACNETGPGHSVLLSGRSPRSSGIVGNAWYDRTLRQRVNVMDDPAIRLVGGSRGRAASPAYFNAFTVGDMLKASSPASRVVGVSFKDRGAVLPAGRRADGAYWFQTTDGRFVTSSWYTDRAPDWLERWNARKVADAYAGRSWQRLLPDPASYVRFAGEDAGEGEFDRRDVVFPHAIRSAPPAVQYYDDLRRTPFADEVLLDFALAAMRGHDLGSDAATDILTVSFSASDVIGHSFGPDSQEQMDNLLRLDRTIGSLFEEAERRAGAGRSCSCSPTTAGCPRRAEGRGIDAPRGRGELLSRWSWRFRRFPARPTCRRPDPMEWCSTARRSRARPELRGSRRRSARPGTGRWEAVHTQAELVGLLPPDDASTATSAFLPPAGRPDRPHQEERYLGGYAAAPGTARCRLRPHVRSSHGARNRGAARCRDRARGHRSRSADAGIAPSRSRLVRTCCRLPQ